VSSGSSAILAVIPHLDVVHRRGNRRSIDQCRTTTE
jgi:hypothetical protein